MSQALLLRVIALEAQYKAMIERLARLEIAMQNLPKEREWPTSRKS